MKQVSLVFSAVLIAAISLASLVQIASAHTTVHAGNYTVEVGWADEPPVVGQRNAFVVNVSNTASPDAVVDVSALTVTLAYGGQTKPLSLQPLSEAGKNQYIAPVLPTVPGLYTVQLRGRLDGTSLSQDVQPEEVLTSDALAFPSVSSGGSASPAKDWGMWLGAAGVVSGLAGLVLGIIALRRKA